MTGFSSEFKTRQTYNHTHCGPGMARGLHTQNVSWPKQACSAPTAVPAGKPSKNQRKQTIPTEAFFLLCSLDLLIKQMWPEMMLGLHPVTANAFLQMCIPFCFGLAHTSLAFGFWERLSDWGWRPGTMQLCHLTRWSQYFTCTNSDRDWMSELHAQAFTEINSHIQH